MESEFTAKQSSRSYTRRDTLKAVVGLLAVGASTGTGVGAQPTQTINVSLDGAVRPLAPYFLGYNAQLLRGPSWRDAAFAQAVKLLDPGNLRYPGGTNANYWDWQQGRIGTDLKDLRNGIDKIKNPVIYGIEELQIAIEATGAVPIFNLNLLTADLDSQLALLRAAKRVRLPVQLVELGNEYYIGFPDYKKKFPTAEDYGRESSRWIKAIRAEFPNVEIAAVGASDKGGERKNQRNRDWNKDLFRTLQGADAVTLHVYTSSGLPQSKSAKLTPEDAPNILSKAFERWERMKAEDFPSLPQGVEAWITEYSLFEREGPVHGTWTQGLYNACLTLLFLEEDRVKLVCNHNLAGGDPSFAAIYANANGLADRPDKPKTTPFALSGNGAGMSLLGTAITGMTSKQKLSFAANPTVRGRNSGTYPSLLGWLFANGPSRQMLVMNLSSQNQTLQMGSVFPGEVPFEQLSGSPTTLVTGPNSLVRTSSKASQRLTLPAYSVTRLG